jgi:hypothetical protein
LLMRMAQIHRLDIQGSVRPAWSYCYLCCCGEKDAWVWTSLTTTSLCDFGQGRLRVSVSPSVRFLHRICEAIRVPKNKTGQWDRPWLQNHGVERAIWTEMPKLDAPGEVRWEYPCP